MNEDLVLAFLVEPSLLTASIGFFLLIILSFIPFVPMPLVFGTIGFTFDLWIALLLNVTAAVTGSFLVFWLVRRIFFVQAQNYLDRRPRAKRFLELVESRGFFFIFLGRVIPIIPSVGVNVVSGIAHVSSRTFVVATLLGKFPLIFVYTYAGHHVDTYTWQSISLLIVYTGLILFAAHRFQEKWAFRQQAFHK